MPRKKSGEQSVNDASSGLDREGYGTVGGGAWDGRERREAQRSGGDTGGGVPRARRKTDDSLAREIHEILTSDPELDAAEIEVEVEGGAVTLSGEVDHPDAKLLAEELTESVAGVRLVHNRLVVRR